MNITYDAAGRRSSLTASNGITATYTYDQASRLLEPFFVSGYAFLAFLWRNI